MHVDSSHPNAGYAVASFRVPNFEENKQTIEIQVSFIVNLRSMRKKPLNVFENIDTFNF